jgi:hypothetical protein
MLNQGIKNLIVSVLIVTVMFMHVSLFADDAAKVPPPKVELKDSDNSSFTAFQFSFFSPLQIFPKEDNVYGLRLTLPYGENDTLVGFDLGICNQLNNLYGISFAALLAQRTENMYGISLSGIFNISEGDDIGLSMAGFYNEVHTIKGVQSAFLYNQAKVVKGVQFGLVNYCHDMRGAQVGIINFCETQPFPFTLLFNFWR